MDDEIRFISTNNIDQQMKEFAKMAILFASNEYPFDIYKQVPLIKKKFEDHYDGYWNCSIFESGSGASNVRYNKFFIRARYDGYIYKIWRHSE